MISDVLMLSLATFSITFVIRFTYGPFDIIKHFKEWIGIKHVPIQHDVNGIATTYQEIPGEGFFAQLFSCHVCLSFWVAIVMMLIHFFVPFGYYITLLFSIYGFAIVLLNHN